MSDPLNDALKSALDSSDAILIAEHGRVSSLHKHNVEMGDRYITTYIAFFSALVILLIGIVEFGTLNVNEILSSELLILGTIIGIGVITYRRLLERRIKHIEYLRAINRLHAYFVAKDPDIEAYLYWPARDDMPPIHTRGTVLGGLIDIVSLLNSVAVGMIAVLIAIHVQDGAVNYLVPVLIGFVCTLISLIVLNRFQKRELSLADRKLSAKVTLPEEKIING